MTCVHIYRFIIKIIIIRNYTLVYFSAVSIAISLIFSSKYVLTPTINKSYLKNTDTHTDTHLDRLNGWQCIYLMLINWDTAIIYFYFLYVEYVTFTVYT